MADEVTVEAISQVTRIQPGAGTADTTKQRPAKKQRRLATKDSVQLSDAAQATLAAAKSVTK